MAADALRELVPQDARTVHAGRDDLTDLAVHTVHLDVSTTYPGRDNRGEVARPDVSGTGERTPVMGVDGRWLHLPPRAG